MIIKFQINLAFLIYAAVSLSSMQDYIPPSAKFNLTNWKLQIPGPVEIKDLKGYASPYFYLTPEGFMHFHLDASEKGTTPNATHVRDELRNLQNWKIIENHQLSTIIRVKCSISDFNVTIIQIKCVTDNNDNVPPFLRVAVEGKNLYAHLKENVNNNKGTKILLKSDVNDMFLSINVKVKDKKLIIAVDDSEVLSRDVSYWVLNNHFKMGCYPQQSEGVFDIDVKNIVVN